MPGRTLGSGTKEGFTGKEQDAETGLDYFGARYYMPALGRWSAVDPLAEKHLEWSPYNYVLNNPLALIDPDGQQVAANQQCQAFCGNFTGREAWMALAGIGRRTEPLKRLEPVMTVIAASPTLGFGAMAGASALVTATADVAGTVGGELAARAGEIHDALPERTQNSTTTAVGTAQNADGSTRTLVGSSEGRLRPAQRAALQPGEVAVAGKRGVHAEMNVLSAAERNGQKLVAVAASRGICPKCLAVLAAARVAIASVLK